MEPYAVHAIRYGSHERTAAQNFIGGDPHETASNLDYYVWLVSNRDRTLVVDTGFTREEAARRERNVFQEPAEGLARLGVEAARIEDVVITHMHYDHAGSLGAFPNARFHIQDDEMAYCTGRYMAHECFGMPYSTEHVIEMVRAVFAKRVAFHRGDEEIAPGVSLHRIGGHTMGIQSVRVWTESGWLVLASDAAHLYENMEAVRPFPIVFNVQEMVDGFEKLKGLAETPEHVIPGHDPLVMQRYPCPSPELEGIAVRLDRGRVPGTA